MTRAGVLELIGRSDESIEQLNQLLTDAPNAFAGWTIPVEPLLEPLEKLSSFGQVLNQLAERAR